MEFAAAKVNLTLRVLDRRADGYHELESLVAFARIGDHVSLTPATDLAIAVSGPTAAAAGSNADNLVLKAAGALRDRVDGLTLGRFHLTKRLPVAAGLGGGSADAAAALRLLAGVNGIALDDPRLVEAAIATGADVPVCLASRARVMRGIGDVLEPLDLSSLAAVLVNPGAALATKDVFAARRASSSFTGESLPSGYDPRIDDPGVEPGEAASGQPGNATAGLHSPALSGKRGRARAQALFEFIRCGTNDLEAAAIGLQPVIAEVITTLHALSGCRLARMSGSGATCFALFASWRAAAAAARDLRKIRADWWVRATVLG